MANKDYFTNSMSYSDWSYHKNKSDSLGYISPKGFHGSYGQRGDSYAFSTKSSENYSI